MKQRTGTVNCMIVTLILCIIAELIGPLQFKVMGVDVKILTMIWVIIMGILLSPSLLGKVIPPLKKVIGHAEISRAPYLLSLTLYPLGIMFGISAGPKVGIVLQAGPALLFQELGNLATMLIALPLGLLIGLGRSAVGGTFSLCRDTALGIIPCGSGNGLARHLHIPMEPKRALEVLNEGCMDVIDYGKINGTDFFCTCGVGFDAFVSLKFANAGKRGLLTYLEKTLQESLTYQPETYELETEDGTYKYKAFLIA